jgi:hypothetical protein
MRPVKKGVPVEGYNLHPDGTTPSFIHLDEINTKSLLEAALDYRGRGFVVTSLRGKRPVLGRWPERVLGEAELSRYFADERSNIGVILGGAGGIVDVDLDNPLVVNVADLLLPDTVKSGREKNPYSHYWYQCKPAPPTRKYTLPRFMAGKLMVEPGEHVLVELRSTGQQTMVPPSVHPDSGDRCLWYPGEVHSIDGETLTNFVLDVAIATLLALHRPLGSRTWVAIHAVVYLSPRLGPERAEKIVEAASKLFDDEEHDERMRGVHSFLRKPVDDDAPMTEDLLAAELERLAPGVPALIERWCARCNGGGAR